MTDVRERLRRVRTKRTNDGFASDSASRLVIPTKNRRSVASPLFPTMEDLALT